MEQLSIASFLKQGHEYHLYAYDQVRGAPRGTVLKCAEEILPRSLVFRDEEAGSYAAFSNIFRYKLLLEKGGYWADSDVVCLRPFDFDSEYIFAREAVPHEKAVREDPTTVTTNVIKAPAQSDIMRFCYAASLSKAAGRFTWGELGPALLAAAVTRFGLVRNVMSTATFCPIDHWNWADTVSDRADVQNRVLTRLTADVYSIHLWHELWRRAGADKDAAYHPGCLYERLKRRYL